MIANTADQRTSLPNYLLIAAAAIGILAVACGAIPSAYRVDLGQSSWVVASVDGRTADDPVALTFNEQGVDGVVKVTTVCGTTQLGVDQDSDGDDITFFDPERLQTLECSPNQRAQEQQLLDGLVAVESWKVIDDDHIELVGPSYLRLNRHT